MIWKTELEWGIEITCLSKMYSKNEVSSKLFVVVRAQTAQW